jgi:hypothetical protein
LENGGQPSRLLSARTDRLAILVRRVIALLQGITPDCMRILIEAFDYDNAAT